MRVGSSKKGFTLIELLVVIAIIAILAAILFPVFSAAKKKGQQANCVGNLKQLVIASQAYYGDYGEYTHLATPPDNVPDYILKNDPWFKNYHNPFKDPNGSNPARFSPIFKYCKSTDIMLCPAIKGKVRVADQKCKDSGWDVGTKRNPAWTYTWCAPWSNIEGATASAVRRPSKKGIWVEENLDPSVKHPLDPQYSVQINDMSFSQTDITAYTHNGKSNIAFMDGHVGSVQGGLVHDYAKWPDGILMFRITVNGD